MAKRFLGYSVFSPRRSGAFYADLGPDSSGYQELFAERRDRHCGFGVVSFERSFRAHTSMNESGAQRNCFTSQPVMVAVVSRQPPNFHPEHLKRLVPIGVHLRADTFGFLTPVGPNPTADTLTITKMGRFPSCGKKSPVPRECPLIAR